MKFKSLMVWIKMILILFSFFCHKINGSCVCSSYACTGCSANINGLYCIDDLICEHNLLYLTLDSNAGLFYTRTSNGIILDNDENNDACLIYGKTLAEIGSTAYYDYISNLIISTLNANLSSITTPLYIKLNINSNYLFDKLNLMTLPLGQNAFAFSTTPYCDEEFTGLKIEIIGNESFVQVGCYNNIAMRGILCLSSINSTIMSASTNVITSTHTTSMMPTTTILDCNLCEKEEITETCIVTFNFDNNTKATQLIDCYELDKVEIKKVEEFKKQIEKRKSEQLTKIQEQTQKELKKLEAKYSTIDKVSKSFAFLAYVLIGLFICFITFGDFMKLIKFLLKLIKNDKQSGIKCENSRKNKKRDVQKDLSQVDPEKLKNLDKRIFDMQIQIKKSLRKGESLYNV